MREASSTLSIGVGDTFRWKGENVATMEVAEVIMGCPGVQEAVVYGVEVPGTDGRAGMAAVLPGAGFEIVRLRQHMAELLPDYARPVFLRLSRHIAATGTFKPSKQMLLDEGFDPSVVSDPLYVNCREQQAFLLLDNALHAKIRCGSIRL